MSTNESAIMNISVGISLNGSSCLSMSWLMCISVRMCFKVNLSKSRKINVNMTANMGHILKIQNWPFDYTVVPLDAKMANEMLKMEGVTPF